MNDAMNTDLYEYSHHPMTPMYRKFDNDIFVGFLVIMKNVLIPFIKEYRGSTLKPPCEAIADVNTMKAPFWA